MKHITIAAGCLLSFSAMAQLGDPGFEMAGEDGATFWTQESTNYGTPLCDGATCLGDANANFSHSGAWWMWFGGTNSSGTLPEIGAIEQMATVPSGSSGTLDMYVWIAAGSAANDNLEIIVDGNTLHTITMADTVTFGADYAQLNVDISSYCDGGQHTVRVQGQQNDGSDISNIFVDDVSMTIDGNVIVGLFEGPDAEGFALYPNPANDRIELRFGNLHGEAMVTVADITGKVVSTQRIAQVEQGSLTCDSRTFPNGVYVVTVEQGGKHYAQRVVVAH
ncbi:MAG: T9SS type A sorting domain-containing protein [Flavobacteriales bacterium]|nr:T9SS type A sorting domain-containing protein [Flavobacteriales bacterium]MCB9193886.1 T9SS type A sorting domain-containing protein [Flavobacteriales bacterium]